MATDILTGATITFSSGFMAEIVGVDWGGIERPSINTSHTGTTPAHTFIPGDLFDPGELSVDLNFDPATKPPINGAAETVTVTIPDSPGSAPTTTWAATAFLTNFNWTGQNEDKMTATANLKFSGDITVT